MKFLEEFAPLAGRSHLQVLAQTDSTNNRVKELADAGAPSGAAVIADWQTAGRGRLGRSFSSPAGVGLYLSYLLRPTLPEDRLMTVPALAAVAGARAVRRAAGLDCGIKWPNDLVCAGRKVSGILTELVPTQSGPAVVIGIGTFLTTVIDFILVAFVVFLVVKAFNAAKQKLEKPAEPEPEPEEPEPTKEELLLTEIRDLLKTKG